MTKECRVDPTLADKIEKQRQHFKKIGMDNKYLLDGHIYLNDEDFEAIDKLNEIESLKKENKRIRKLFWSLTILVLIYMIFVTAVILRAMVFH